MNRPLTATLVLCFSLAASGFAAEKKTRKSTKKPRSVPPQSKMIVIPPPTDPAITSGETPKLISSEMSGKDLQFFTAAVEAGRGQAYLVNLLQARAESAQIKSLGEALAATQEEENRQITRLAGIKGWQVSTEPTAAQKKIGAELEKQTGSDFDKAVMDRLIAASQRSVTAYEAAASSSDADIQSFASQMLPVAQEKLRLAEKMTGAGKAAAKFFRTGTPEAVAPGSTPKPIPPPITQ
jgi:predicted outer membrane protein